MRNLAIIILITLIVLAVYQFFLQEEIDNDTKPNGMITEELEIVYVGEGVDATGIRVINQEGEELYAIHITELQSWLENNWDIFEDPPQVALRPIEPENLSFFDPSASISLDRTHLAFSVHDYSSLTTESFIFMADIESARLNVVNEIVRGSVEEFTWSPDSDLLAYTLGTARAQGDRLAVDSVKRLERVAVLDSEDLLDALKDVDDDIQLIPRFRYLEWIQGKLHFTTDSFDDEEIEWSLDIETGDLVTDEQ